MKTKKQRTQKLANLANFPDHTYRILLIGSSACGKTNALLKYYKCISKQQALDADSRAI